MNLIALWIGYSVMVLGGVILTALVVCVTTYYVNVACSKALKTYGGWKTFKEYVEWYKTEKKA